ncbi:MAG: disulfide bond formation protein DsbA [Candidatus Eremiobacteraeota bacterium]|nr:disulfide bond formation protein DsbA [Candidatus Eremiobacteraeota bacterium]
MKVTAFVDVLSHWCYAAYPALEALRATIAQDVEVEIVFAPAFGNANVPMSREAEVWFYERGALAYGRQLTSAWCEGSRQSSTWHANAAVLAAVNAGADPLRLGAQVSRAGMSDGRLIGREIEAAGCIAELTGMQPQAVLDAMRSATVVEALDAGNARLAALGCAERPSWQLVNGAGDHSVLQGVWQAEAILPLARALLEDERAYRRAGPMPENL